MEIRNLERMKQLKKAPHPHNFELIDNFSKFLELTREFVNSDAVLEQIGTFLSEDSIEQEGSLPLLVPIKIIGKNVFIDEEVVNKFLISIMYTMNVYLELEAFCEGTFTYDSTKFYNLFAHNFYSKSSYTSPEIIAPKPRSLDRSESISVNDKNFNNTILDTSTQNIKNLNESRNFDNGSDPIFKDDSKSIDSGDSMNNDKDINTTKDDSKSKNYSSKRSESTFETDKTKKNVDTSFPRNKKGDKKKKSGKKEKDKKVGGDEDKVGSKRVI